MKPEPNPPGNRTEPSPSKNGKHLDSKPPDSKIPDSESKKQTRGPRKHRPVFIEALKVVILREYLCQRSIDSSLGNEYDTIRAKLLFRFNQSELEDLAAFSAACVVDANFMCDMIMKRQASGNSPDITFKRKL